MHGSYYMIDDRIWCYP